MLCRGAIDGSERRGALADYRPQLLRAVIDPAGSSNAYDVSTHPVR